MVNDAKIHEKEDKKSRELAETRNMADSLINQIKNSGYQSPEITKCIEEIEEEIKGNDINKLKKLMARLSDLLSKEQQKQNIDNSSQHSDYQNEDDVIDAEFEEKK